LPHFALVSGSETSSDAWSVVLDRLRSAGHTCHIHSLDEIAWANGIEAGVQALAARIGSVTETILVGHSIAGLFLPSIGKAIGATNQVYIAAIIPQPARSVFEQLLMGEELFSPSWTEGYGTMRRSTEPRISHRHFLEGHLFHDCPPQSLERYWMQSDLPLREIYEVPHPSPETSQRSHFIVCAGDRTLQPRSQRPTSEQLPCATVTEINTGHCPHLAAPEELADLILSITVNADLAE
jgi:hypothetical protein